MSYTTGLVLLVRGEKKPAVVKLDGKYLEVFGTEESHRGGKSVLNLEDGVFN